MPDGNLSWVTPPVFRRNRYNLLGRPSRRDARQTSLATAREGELAAEALGVVTTLLESKNHGATTEWQRKCGRFSDASRADVTKPPITNLALQPVRAYAHLPRAL